MISQNYKGNGFLRDKPFEHVAIIGTLHDDLFGGCRSIIRSFPSKYKPGEEGSYALTPAMVALAATLYVLITTPEHYS